MTFYYPEDTPPGQGACGAFLKNSDYVISMNPSQFDGNRDAVCFQTVCVSFGGRSVQGVVHDRCAGCAFGSIDVTPPVFTALNTLSTGVFDVEWNFGSCTPPPETTTQPDQTSPSQPDQTTQSEQSPPNTNNFPTQTSSITYSTTVLSNNSTMVLPGQNVNPVPTMSENVTQVVEPVPLTYYTFTWPQPSPSSTPVAERRHCWRQN